MINLIFEENYFTMKNATFILAILAVLWCFPLVTKAQCTPGNEITCPDPEGNGQICPDVLPDATVNQLYHQEFTILAPSQYTDSTTGLTVQLDHLRIIDIGNLPPGITWTPNVADSILLPGVYNCVLLEGTCDTKGTYTLQINVEVTIFFGQPILFDTIVDSTSLAINVVDASGIGEYSQSSFEITGSGPNPFNSYFEVTFNIREPARVTFEIFNVLGTLIHHENISAGPGENRFVFDATGLDPGIYIYKLADERTNLTRRLIKRN